ncbi:RNA-binding cell elongation regulator Jag/EloR [Chloroflexota bacterium]
MVDNEIDNEINIEEIARDILEALLDRMGVAAAVELCEEPYVEEEITTPPVSFDIKGDDLGILIGRRGQTLSCLQYILRLIMTHQTNTWMPVTLDVEGYKQRRYKALQTLANRMAEQVKLKGTSFNLEPMSAYERRIIHLTLADNPDVSTQSAGEGENRKVVILPQWQ